MKSLSRLGRYEIRDELGRGAMGVVYEGFDPAIDRIVAIKMLQLEQVPTAMTAEVRTRFRREAQAAGRLSHPSIVSVHEYSDGDVEVDGRPGRPYIVMEKVAGRTLKALFDANTRFTLDETARLMGELLAALQHAHERGVVHRDIKPSNLIVLDGRPPNRLKVADFGIARLDSSELTLSGSTLGTVSHMSPEQFLGLAIDGRTDVYACGVILYQFLTGELPFTGSPTTIMQKVLNQEVLAPSVLDTTLPRVWDPIVRKAMAKKAGDRLADAASFAAAIGAASTSFDPDSTVVRHSPAAMHLRPNRALVVGLAATFVAASAYGLFVATRRPAALIADRPAVPPVASAATATVASVAPVASEPSSLLPPTPTVQGPAKGAVPGAADVEAQVWADALAANSAAAYRAFLSACPPIRRASSLAAPEVVSRCWRLGLLPRRQQPACHAVPGRHLPPPRQHLPRPRRGSRS